MHRTDCRDPYSSDCRHEHRQEATWVVALDISTCHCQCHGRPGAGRRARLPVRHVWVCGLAARMHTVQQALAKALAWSPKSVALGTGVPAVRLALGGTEALQVQRYAGTGWHWVRQVWP